MSPDTSTADDVAAGRVPVNIRNAVVFRSLHQLNIGVQFLLALLDLRLLAFKVQIPEIEIKVLLRVNCGNHDESSLWRPVDGIAGLLVNGTGKAEAAHASALHLLGGKERNRRLRSDARASNSFSRGDQDETVTLRFPSEVDDRIFQAVYNLHGHALLLDTEDLQVRSHGFLRLGVTVNLNADVGTLRLPVQLNVGDVKQVSSSNNFL